MRRMGWPKSFHRSPTGNAAAAEFDRLLRDHIPAFYQCAYRWTGTVDRAEDLVQELLVRLYPMLDELRALDRPRPWAMRVMYRIFVDRLRHERSSPVQFGLEPEGSDTDANEEAHYIDPTEQPCELVERQLTQERVVAAWLQLAQEHRVVLSMHDIEGYSLVELSSMLDIPLGDRKSVV